MTDPNGSDKALWDLWLMLTRLLDPHAPPTEPPPQWEDTAPFTRPAIDDDE